MSAKPVKAFSNVGGAALMLLALALAAPRVAATAESRSADAVVHVADFAYKPPALRIHTGQSVLFVNDDDEAHTVTSNDKSFDSGGLDTHESWRHTFTRRGTYRYFCALHPYMKAVVVVSDDATK